MGILHRLLHMSVWDAGVINDRDHALP